MMTEPFSPVGYSIGNESKPGKMYEYLMAGNGLFVRASRPGLTAKIPLAFTEKPVRGLPDATLNVDLVHKVTPGLLLRILFLSRQNLPNETLFYLNFATVWRLDWPAQTNTPGHCEPIDPFNPAGQTALIEVHSHGSMNAYFSNTDDRDETGFRIYAVVGKLDTHFPEIIVRVGVYGHHCVIPANLVFDSYDLYEVRDAYERFC